MAKLHAAIGFFQQFSNWTVSTNGAYNLSAAGTKLAFKIYPRSTSSIVAANVAFTKVGTVTNQNFKVQIETDLNDTPSGTVLSASAEFAGPSLASGWLGNKVLNTGTLTLNTPYWIVIYPSSGTAPSASNYIESRYRTLNEFGGRHRRFDGTNWTNVAALNVAGYVYVTHLDGTVTGIPMNTPVSSATTRVYGNNRQAVKFRFGTAITIRGIMWTPYTLGTPANLEVCYYEGSTLKFTETILQSSLVVNAAISTPIPLYFTNPVLTRENTDIYIVFRQAGNGGSAGNDYALWSAVMNEDVVVPSSFGLFSGTGDNPTLYTRVTTHLPACFTVICDDFSDTTEGIYPSAADVRSGTAFGYSQNGSLDLPSVNDVRSGTQFDSTTKTGLLNLPSINDVRSGTTFDQTTKTGLLNLPSVNDVRSGTTFDQTTKTGLLDLPNILDVRYNTRFDRNTKTGQLNLPDEASVRFMTSYDSGTKNGLIVVPGPRDVRKDVIFDTGASGTLELPLVADVRAGVHFDSSSIGLLDLPSVNDVRSGTTFDQTTKTGLLNLPSVNDVRSGTTFDQTTKTGLLNLPSVNDVRSGTTFDQTMKTGLLNLPEINDVRSGIQYDQNSKTGQLNLPNILDVRSGIEFDQGDQIGRLDLPSTFNVRSGVTYDSFSKLGSLDLPAQNDVRSGVLFDSAFQEGTLDLPLQTDVRSGVQYDSNSKTGNIILPAIDDVRIDVQYGANASEYTGNMTTTNIQFSLPLDIVDFSELSVIDLTNTYEVIDI